jgi:flagellar FliJ protein
VGRPFKLQAVLNQRQHREECARKVLAEAVRALRQAEKTLADIENVRACYRKTMRLKQANSAAAMEIMLYMRFLERLDKEIAAQQQVVDKLVQEKESKRQALMSTLKDRKVMEKLKDRYLADLEQKERENEQKLLNEAAINRYQRKA